MENDNILKEDIKALLRNKTCYTCYYRGWYISNQELYKCRYIFSKKYNCCVKATDMCDGWLRWLRNY